MKVLFIGNSQMQCYDLPAMIESMAASAPADSPRIEAGKVLIGGGTLKKYWDAGEATGTPRALIASDRWDYVVVQEIYNANARDFEDYAARFDEAIRKAGSKPILFATANVTEHYSPNFRYPDSFVALNGMQVDFGARRGIPVAAAGYAWMKYLGPNPPEARLLDLYDKDKGHPGPKGTYLYACLLYAVITGKTPVGLAGEFKSIRGGIAIPPGEAAAMQRAAWAQYRESRTPPPAGAAK
jgi:hypothetical protein